LELEKGVGCGEVALRIVFNVDVLRRAVLLKGKQKLRVLNVCRGHVSHRIGKRNGIYCVRRIDDPDVAKTNGLRVLQPRKLTLANSGTVVRGINALEVFGYKVRLFLL
jgi:hypothetical protein